MKGLEKNIAFMINKNLAFIDSIQFMNSSLKKLVKSLGDNDFKYLTQELDSNKLELLKRKYAYPYEYMGSFERLSEEKLPDKNCFYRSLKDTATGDKCKKVDGYIIDEEYLACVGVWNTFSIKRMGDYLDHYFKKRSFFITCFWKIHQ